MKNGDSVTQTYRISGSQLFWLFASFEVGMTMLLTISPTIVEAKQDAWMSFILASLCAILISFIGAKLSLLYPNQTLVEYSQTILGKWPGKFVILLYLLQWYPATAVIFRQSSDFIATSMFHRTPLLVIMLIMASIVTYVVYNGGIEGIARCSEIMGPVIFLTIATTICLNLANVHLKNLLPMYFDSGWLPILKGTMNPLSFLGESNIIMMILCFMAKPKLGPSRVMMGVGAASLTTVITTLMVIMTFGAGIASKLWYPYFDLVRFISVGDFIQNVDALVIVVWIMSVFIKLSVYLFIAAYGTAQLLNRANWNQYVWVVVTITVISGILFPNIDVSSVEFAKVYWAKFVLPVDLIGIPLLLWIIGVIRKGRQIG